MSDRTDRELRRILTELQTLLDVLPIGIGIAEDRDCRRIRVNRAFAQTLGIAPDANASKTAPPGERPTNFRVLHPDGSEIADDQLPLQLAAREGIAVNGVELDVVHENGRIVRLLEYAAPLFDEHGGSRGAVGAFIDITASHQAKRRDQFLVGFDSATRGLIDPGPVANAFARLLASELRIEAVEYGEVASADPLRFRVLGASPAGGDGAIGRLARSVDASAAGRLREGEAVTADGAVLIPLVREGRLVAGAALVHGAPRRWTAGDVDLATQGTRACHDRIDRARVTRTLVESEERYRRIFDTAGVSIWEEDFSEVKAALDALTASGVSDLERYIAEHPEFVERCMELVRVVNVNDATLGMFRAPSKETLLASLRHIFAEGTRRMFVGELLAVARGDRRFESEADLRTLDRRELHAMVTVTFPGPGQSFRSVLVSLADITARKRAEAELRDSERLFREMADAAPVMLWITDPQGVCTFVTRSWFEFTGQQPPQGVGLGWTDAVHPDERLLARQAFVDAHAARAPFRIEYRLRRHDGDYRWVLDTARPRFSESGEYLGYVGAVIDISERKAAETALEQEVEIRSALARVGASLAGELQTDRLVQAVTDAGTRLTGAEFGAFFYEGAGDADESAPVYTVSGAPRAAFGQSGGDDLGPVLRAGHSLRVDDLTRDAQGAPHGAHHGLHGLPVRSHLAVPVVARGGRVLGGLFFWHREPGVFTTHREQLATGVASWAAIALDNARLYRDLEHASRLKDEFLATLSHELRTPLNAVLGWAHILRAGAVAPDVQRRALESVERNARAQAQLVEDLLDVSRIVSGKLQIRADAVDVATVVTNAVDTVRPAAHAKRVSLRLRLDPAERILVTGDADRLQQIAWNLLSNAIKFTPSGGCVELEMRHEASQVDIIVRDTGQGFSPAFRRHLFERFRQSDSSTVRRHGGLGLGLSIVRHLTEAHGGAADAESPGEGQGATFRVTLPVRSVEPAMAPAGAREEPGTPPVLAGAHVLTVDDEVDARELVRYLLESRGAHVLSAASVEEALLVIGREHVDVLVADIGMPEQDGYALVHQLRSRQDERIAGLPAIAVTAYASMREREQALAAGYDWHLPKPVDSEQLVALVARALSTRARLE